MHFVQKKAATIYLSQPIKSSCFRCRGKEKIVQNGQTEPESVYYKKDLQNCRSFIIKFFINTRKNNSIILFCLFAVCAFCRALILLRYTHPSLRLRICTSSCSQPLFRYSLYILLPPSASRKAFCILKRRS